MNTLLLSSSWDLSLDANNNVALATGNYALAQDAASAVRTFAGEVYYNSLLGLPYWLSILGQLPPLNFLRSQYVAAARAVPGVAKVQVFFSSFVNRQLSGQVQITSVSGQTSAVIF